VQSGATQIGGFDAFRVLAEAQSQQGQVAVDATWIAHPKGMFRITGLSSPQRYRSWAPVLQQSTKSFRAIRASERELARPTRLRLATARAGESLAELGRRHGNRWSLAETAVANGLEPGGDAALRSGQKIKIAVRE
jgi:predicted Zn-dependent protease